MSDDCSQYLVQLQKDWERQRVRLGVEAIRKEVRMNFRFFCETMINVVRNRSAIATTIWMMTASPQKTRRRTVRRHATSHTLQVLLMNHLRARAISTFFSTNLQTNQSGNLSNHRRCLESCSSPGTCCHSACLQIPAFSLPSPGEGSTEKMRPIPTTLIETLS